MGAGFAVGSEGGWAAVEAAGWVKGVVGGWEVGEAAGWVAGVEGVEGVEAVPKEDEAERDLAMAGSWRVGLAVKGWEPGLVAGWVVGGWAKLQSQQATGVEHVSA
jgi:hypothetical protein